MQITPLAFDQSVFLKQEGHVATHLTTPMPATRLAHGEESFS